MHNLANNKTGKKIVCSIICSAIPFLLISGCSKGAAINIDDESTPLADKATYESTVEVLEQGVAESYIGELEEGEYFC